MLRLNLSDGFLYLTNVRYRFITQRQDVQNPANMDINADYKWLISVSLILAFLNYPPN